MRTLAILLLFLSFSSFTGKNEVKHTPSPIIVGTGIRMESARETPRPECKVDVVTIPFKRAGRLILIEAKIDSIKGDFIFDTGAPYLVLNKTYFRNYKKDYGRYAQGISGNSSSALYSVVKKLQIKDLGYSDVQADVASLADIENARGTKILGLLGLNLFTAFEIEVDWRENIVRLYKLNPDGTCKVKPKGVECEIESPISVVNNTVFTECLVGGKRLRFGLDTGAEINALSSSSEKSVLASVTVTGRRQLMGVGDETVEILFGRLNSFKLRDFDLYGMQTMVTNMEGMSDAYGVRIDGMLGYDFFAQGKVFINCKKGSMKLCLFDKFDRQ